MPVVHKSKRIEQLDLALLTPKLIIMTVITLRSRGRVVACTQRSYLVADTLLTSRAVNRRSRHPSIHYSRRPLLILLHLL